MTNIKKISLVILVIFYLLAGANHFYNPSSYYRLIPKYLPYPVALNILAGIAEILFALLLLLPKTRRLAVYGIMLMLLAFLPVHIQMVIDAPFILGTLAISPLVAWIRLVVLQPLLILWAWWHRR
ncbi:DoxX family protein [Mucilaginibacter psychrotolerans]|uniref:DoxX family protein n=1 Tax=Mucilaginibacter psychrotolerans TaxID=1524096 RepID=A0A4Y8SGT5_9SPHI|nr:DoxX family protein [Mucilaginibacter psychrotolerans]